MNFSIDKAEAVRALGLVSRVVPQRAVVPVLKTILVNAKDGCVEFQSTDLEISIAVRAPAQVKTEGSCCIDSMIPDLVSNFDDDEPIRFSVDKNRLVISQAKRKHRLGIIDADEFPRRREITGYEPIDAGKFVRAVSCCVKSASDDLQRPILQACNFDPDRKRAACGDGYRLTIYRDTFPGVLSNPAARHIGGWLLNEIKSLPSDEKLEAVFGEYSGIRSSRWDVQLGSIEGTFPDVEAIYNDVRNMEEQLSLKVNKGELSRKIDICNLYVMRSQSGTPFAELVRAGDEVSLNVKTPDFGDMHEVLRDFEVKGTETFAVAFAPRFISAALDTIRSDNVLFRFVDDKRPFLVLDETDDLLVHVIMPGLLPKEGDF